MDRRIVAGMVGLALVGSSQTSRGQYRDVNSAGSVGFTPLDPITSRINNAAPTPGQDRAAVPSDPTTSGPQARVPTPPVGPNPVGMTPQPRLADSIADGYPTTGFGWFGRRRAAAAARKAARQNPPAPATYDPATVPAGMAWDESGQNPTAANSIVAGRPAPFVEEVPDGPRPQALRPVSPAIRDGDGSALQGRPAPFASETPTKGRPRLGVNAQTAPRARPQAGAPGDPRPVAPAATPGPAPEIPTTLPDLDSSTEPAPAATPGTPDPGLPAMPSGPVFPSASPAPSAAVSREPVGTEAPNPGLQPLPEASATALTDQASAAPASALPELAPAALPELAPAVPPDRSAAPGLAPLPDLAPTPLPGDLGASAPAAANSTGAAIPPSPVALGSVELASAPATADSSRIDPGLQRTSAMVEDQTAIRIDKNRDKDRPFAAARAAAVGNEVITVHEVESLVVEKYKKMTEGQPIPADDRRELINALGTMALDHLIEQSLILQEARRMMKNPKMKEQFDEFADKRWAEERLPELLRKHNAVNVYELQDKLAADGQSYPEMVEAYRRDLLEHDFLFREVRNKFSVDRVNLKSYYNKHLHDYDQPARLSWREIEINVGKYPDRAAARRQADAILARLRKEDFAAVATAASDGPTASKGGLYADMTPGAYGIAPVNAALSTLAEGTISPVIEAPASFHIIRVESRRAAGPLRFDEVQKQVADAVFEEGFLKARAEYLAKLRSRTLVRVMPMFERAKVHEQERIRREEAQTTMPVSRR